MNEPDLTIIYDSSSIRAGPALLRQLEDYKLLDKLFMLNIIMYVNFFAFCGQHTEISNGPVAVGAPGAISSGTTT